MKSQDLGKLSWPFEKLSHIFKTKNFSEDRLQTFNLICLNSSKSFYPGLKYCNQEHKQIIYLFGCLNVCLKRKVNVDYWVNNIWNILELLDYKLWHVKYLRSNRILYLSVLLDNYHILTVLWTFFNLLFP